MIKCEEVRGKPWMKALCSVLTLKWRLGVRSIVYASYRKTELASLLFNTFHRWQQNFFFSIHPRFRLWPFSLMCKSTPKLESFLRRPRLSPEDRQLIILIKGTSKIIFKNEVS